VAALSDEALAAVIVEAQDELERRKRKREAEFFDTVRDQAQALGIPADRLMAALGLGGKPAARSRTGGKPDGRSVVRRKFWNPADHAQRWSGRGAPPKWYADHLAGGGAEDDLRIPEGAI
jgi:DNA-binding protein H-NS